MTVGRIASESLISRLADWGVDTVFRLPGDGINGIMEAAFMACGHSKATGRVGVCLANSGPGGIHLANGLYDAKLDHVPVLAITGMQETGVLGTGYQQEVHLDRLFADVAEYNQVVMNPVQLPSIVDNAIRTSYARRGVVHLSVPNDLQVADAEADPWAHVAPAAAPDTSTVYLPPAVRPRQGDLERAAEMLAAPVVKTLKGKMVIADDSPYTTGGIGLLGTGPSEELMDDIDTLLMLGTDFPYTKHLPEPGTIRVVQIDIEPTRAGGRVPTDVPLVGDVGATLEALLPLLPRREDRSHLEAYQHKMDDWRDKMAALREPTRDPIAPQYLAGLLDELAGDHAIMTCDSGTVATWAARHWQIRGGREFYLSGNLATMAPAVPYAIAMQRAHPGRQVIAYLGDGAFAMLMAEFHTAAWHRLPIKVIVNNNNSLGQILWEQMVLGYPEHGVRFGEPSPDYALWARGCGGFGEHVDQPADLPDALRRALEFDGPALVDVAVDANEPPMPGKVEYEQAKKFATAFLKGQPHKAAIATTLFKDRIQQMRGD